MGLMLDPWQNLVLRLNTMQILSFTWPLYVPLHEDAAGDACHLRTHAHCQTLSPRRVMCVHTICASPLTMAMMLAHALCWGPLVAVRHACTCPLLGPLAAGILGLHFA